MLLSVDIPLRKIYRMSRGRRSGRFDASTYQTEIYQTLFASAYKLTMPKVQSVTSPFVFADVFVPEDRRSGIPVLSDRWIAEGIYRANALIKKNHKTLAPFLASGLAEMDVREVA